MFFAHNLLNPLKILAICFALSACVGLQRESDDRAQYYLQIGTAAMMQGKNPEALSNLLQAEELDSDNPTIQNNLGLAYFYRSKFELAEKHIRKAVELRKDYTDARNNLGRVLLEMGRYQESLKELAIAVADLKYPYPEKPLLNMGTAYFRMTDYKRSQDQLLASIQVQRDNCPAYSLYGRTFYEQKEYKRASELLDKAVTYCQKSQYDEPLYFAALSYYQLGERDKSEARFEELLKLYPNGSYNEKSRSMLELIRR